MRPILLATKREALSLSEDYLGLCLEVHGERHAATLAAMVSYGTLLPNFGRAAEARLIFEQHLQLCKEENGERHKDTLASMVIVPLFVTPNAPTHSPPTDSTTPAPPRPAPPRPTRHSQPLFF